MLFLVKSRPRLKTFDHRGSYRYSVTICTAHRVTWFDTAEIAEAVLSQIKRSAIQHQFAILAYCFMPDHVHLLVEGRTPDANLQTFVKHAKQITGYEHRQRHAKALWQPSWYDRVLRKEEETREVIKYILLNPVRAGLVKSAADYPLSGSEVYAVRDILEDVVRDVKPGTD
jgi:putative transposase